MGRIFQSYIRFVDGVMENLGCMQKDECLRVFGEIPTLGGSELYPVGEEHSCMLAPTRKYVFLGRLISCAAKISEAASSGQGSVCIRPEDVAEKFPVAAEYLLNLRQKAKGEEGGPLIGRVNFAFHPNDCNGNCVLEED